MQAALNNPKVFWNYEKREENELGFCVISDYETNSVLPMPSAAVASSTELWASKNYFYKW